MQFIFGALYGIIVFVSGGFCVWRICKHFEKISVEAAKAKIPKPVWRPANMLDPVSPSRKIEYDDNEEDDEE